jgi:beta-lactamase regulating signal transducer with metallopeptidase domain
VSFASILIVVALASFTSAAALGSAVVPLAWKLRRDDTPAGRRASALLMLRLLPAALAAATAALAAAAFLRFEPRDQEESVGVMLLVLAAGSLALMAATLVRLVRLTVRTKRALRPWIASARRVDFPGMSIPAFIIDASFPIVAVVGVVRPRLIVARSVIDACSEAELRAVVAHERAHLRRRDNARRAILQTTPDLVGWLPIARAIDLAWHDATEEAADDQAAASGDAVRLALASALVRVARLAPPEHAAADLPASALYRGERLERRVRRLLASSPLPSRPSHRARIGIAVAVGTLAALANLGVIYAVLEAAITGLP